MEIYIVRDGKVIVGSTLSKTQADFMAACYRQGNVLPVETMMTATAGYYYDVVLTKVQDGKYFPSARTLSSAPKDLSWGEFEHPSTFDVSEDWTHIHYSVMASDRKAAVDALIAKVRTMENAPSVVLTYEPEPLKVIVKRNGERIAITDEAGWVDFRQQLACTDYHDEVMKSLEWNFVESHRPNDTVMLKRLLKGILSPPKIITAY